MDRISTQSQIILYLYNELKPGEKESFEYQLMSDAELQSEFKSLATILRAMDQISIKPEFELELGKYL